MVKIIGGIVAIGVVLNLPAGKNVGLDFSDFDIWLLVFRAVLGCRQLL